MSVRLKSVPALACAVALSSAPVAAAASNPTQSVYGPATCTACSTVVHHEPQTLPFTGIDVGPLAAIGVGLLGAGAVTRRRLNRGR